MAVYGRLLGELDTNGQRLSEQVSEIDLTDPEDAQVLMPEQGGDILAHFGDERFLDRYRRYKEHIGEWRQAYPKLAAVDLRYEQQVVLEMAPGSSISQAVAGDQAAANAGAGSTGTESPSAASPAGKPEGKAEAKPSSPPNAAPGKPSPKAKPGKAAGKGPTKSKTASKPASKSAKEKARDKKRAEAKRAALNVSKQRSAPTPRPAVATGMGQ
jgi:cell division protein FtsQ